MAEMTSNDLARFRAAVRLRERAVDAAMAHHARAALAPSQPYARATYDAIADLIRADERERWAAAAFALRVLDIVARADLHGSIFWRCDGQHAPATFWVDCSDVFAWATADMEPLTSENLPAFEQALRDVTEVCGDNSYGPELFCARMRAARPQGAAYPDDERLWPLFDACGPERDIGLGNPHRPGGRKRRTVNHSPLSGPCTCVIPGTSYDAGPVDPNCPEHGEQAITIGDG